MPKDQHQPKNAQNHKNHDTPCPKVDMGAKTPHPRTTKSPQKNRHPRLGATSGHPPLANHHKRKKANQTQPSKPEQQGPARKHHPTKPPTTTHKGQKGKQASNPDTPSNQPRRRQAHPPMRHEKNEARAGPVRGSSKQIPVPVPHPFKQRAPHHRAILHPAQKAAH